MEINCLILPVKPEKECRVQLGFYFRQGVIGQLTPWMLSALAAAGTFFLFACMCLPYVWIIWKLVPETAGKSLEEIERMWEN